jgi:hypothetical protein
MSLMPKTDPDELTAGQQWRLRIALDRVMPPFSPPRYMSHRHSGVSAWRLAPASFALGLTGVLALSAYAATGSPNPAVWGQRAASTIGSVRLAPAVVPAPPSSSAAPVAGPKVTTTASAKSTSDPNKPRTEPSDHPEHSGQPGGTPPASSARHGGDPSPTPSPAPEGGGGQ